jgi:hypothetical protein
MYICTSTTLKLEKVIGGPDEIQMPNHLELSGSSYGFQLLLIEMFSLAVRGRANSSHVLAELRPDKEVLM